MSSRSRSITAAALSAMVVLAGPAAAASSGRALLADAPAGGDAAPPTPGQVLIPGMHDDYGSLITAMLANQGGMIGEMASVLHPALADPLASLANMMTIVQTSLPDLLAGAGLPFEPNPLVHEMFVKYSNGSKTEADLAMIDKGLDELFSHDFTEGDKEKLVDFMDMKDAFSKAPLPGKNITLPPKAPKQWPSFMPKNLVNLDVKGYKPAFPDKPHDELDVKEAQILLDQAAQRTFISGKQTALQAELDAKVDKVPKDISVLKANTTAIAKNFGDAYKKKIAPVNYTSSDAKILGQAAVWSALYNKTNLGGLKNGSLSTTAKWGVINLPKKSQNTLLQADELKLNLTKLAFPTNPGKDPLRPLIDVITSDPVGDAIAPVSPFLTFRDPILKGVARTKTTVSSKASPSGANPAPVNVYDRNAPPKWTDPKGGYTSTAAKNLASKASMSKVELFNFGVSKFNYRPCIFSEGYTALSVGAELLRIRPEGLNIGFDGARVSPQLIDVSPVLVKVQAVGSQIAPEFINVEPILVSVSPKVNLVGKAVAKPWQLTKPAKFGPKPKEDKLTLAPYPKPHT